MFWDVKHFEVARILALCQGSVVVLILRGQAVFGVMYALRAPSVFGIWYCGYCRYLQKCGRYRQHWQYFGVMCWCGDCQWALALKKCSVKKLGMRLLTITRNWVCDSELQPGDKIKNGLYKKQELLTPTQYKERGYSEQGGQEN